MADGWEVTENDFGIAFRGLLMQAEAHKVDTTNRANLDFIIHTADYIASQSAGMRFYTNCLDEDF